MSDPDGIYVLAGDDPTLWVYPSAVHAGGETVTDTATGAGGVTYTLQVDLARTAAGEATTSRSITADLEAQASGAGVVDAAVVRPGVPVDATVDGAGTVTYDLVVAPRPTPSPGGGGNTYPTRLRPWERDDWPPEEEPDDQQERDLEALIVLGAL